MYIEIRFSIHGILDEIFFLFDLCSREFDRSAVTVDGYRDNNDDVDDDDDDDEDEDEDEGEEACRSRGREPRAPGLETSSRFKDFLNGPLSPLPFSVPFLLARGEVPHEATLYHRDRVPSLPPSLFSLGPRNYSRIYVNEGTSGQVSSSSSSSVDGVSERQTGRRMERIRGTQEQSEGKEEGREERSKKKKERERERERKKKKKKK